MVWSLETSNGFESDKIAAFTIPYTRGRGLDIGCGQRKVWPNAIGVDNGHHFGQGAAEIVSEATDLSVFADNSLDFVFSSHNLEHIVDTQAALKEWWRVIKPGGHLVLYLPHKDFYPNIGQPGSNPDHKHDFLPVDVVEHMKKIGSWELVENEERNQSNEYSFFQVYRKKQGKGRHIFKVWERNPDGKKRCLVVRYGAIGDQIMVSSILPGLKKQGWHVTYNTTPDAQEILKLDPHVDEWLIQDKDQVPNQQLGPYWDTIKTRYDRIINLCESIEGGLLALPGRLQHQYPEETRRKLFGVNYLERTHDIAAVPHEFAPKFYPSPEEIAWAKKTRAEVNAPVVAWAINGSSPHKVYPYVQIVSAWLIKNTPVHLFLLADPGIGKQLQDGIIETLRKDGVDVSRIHPMAGKWKIREALTFVQHVDCVVGPETGTLNAVGMESVPKVIYLSHSSHENLTKYWKNTTVLEPVNTPCFPCHRLHYSWEHCPQIEDTAAAQCASSIKPETLYEAILEVMLKRIAA